MFTFIINADAPRPTGVLGSPPLALSLPLSFSPSHSLILFLASSPSFLMLSSCPHPTKLPLPLSLLILSLASSPSFLFSGPPPLIPLCSLFVPFPFFPLPHSPLSYSLVLLPSFLYIPSSPFSPHSFLYFIPLLILSFSSPSSHYTPSSPFPLHSFLCLIALRIISSSSLHPTILHFPFPSSFFPLLHSSPYSLVLFSASHYNVKTTWKYRALWGQTQ